MQPASSLVLSLFMFLVFALPGLLHLTASAAKLASMQCERQNTDWQLRIAVQAQTSLLCLPTQSLAPAAWSLIPLPPQHGNSSGVSRQQRELSQLLGSPNSCVCALLVKLMCFKPCHPNRAAITASSEGGLRAADVAVQGHYPSASNLVTVTAQTTNASCPVTRPKQHYIPFICSFHFPAEFLLPADFHLLVL